MATAATDSIVEQVYDKLKAMSVGYDFKPGERLNEGVLASALGVSRTPLREALTRLTTEGLLRFSPGKGFFCRDLDAQEVFSLYEMRKIVETEALRLSLVRAKDEEIDALLAFLEKTGPEPGDRSVEELVRLDETFHESLMAMSGNLEMLRVLRNINARIRFVRWIDMERCDRRVSQNDHREILLGLKARDAERCIPILARHIDRRHDQIATALKEGLAQIYMG
ncbi:GntR family transcriptional regulator [Cupriavidus plantarum]|uniref:GntR family transcriptional regulator n=1 Tax=Cupriavidus plantarum TaxID=942865 RepID=A0A316F074_9BURK|nr:GntR family transcriptional regulator [Cupriavidus plantarum]NYH98669.1 DNA-binding GntR family transcriptional regulator [Cupriavidus plantarum]PWK37702.1 GntR family transcriptional regulator [Cupriavidus plantarum]REF01592.1 DNA-binding GntR family transcriptional regulator [Cupriavidus plantarum]RLK45549.1 DNA-binding GntR family transcriptional regulator [Cupriavidus plantarum]CAG2128098.1 HTH-type transcriptional repressor GlaR [Cupriavidus plantarum]